MNTTTEYLYQNNTPFNSRIDHYEEDNSQSPQQNRGSENQSPQQLNFDCDEETQYSLSEFSHIHLVDGESTENDLYNRTAPVNNTESAYATPNFLLTANIKPSLNSANTFHKHSSTGINSNYLDVNQLTFINNNRKRALSFAACSNDSSMFLLSSLPLNNSSTTQQAPTTNIQNNNNNNNSNALNANNNGNNNEKQRTATKICRVCGDKAYSYNFNVITCESCKAFFRRNANKEKEIRCPFNEQCDINIVSRRFCQRCRLQKCFGVGMKKEWIMTEEARLEKKQRIQTNRERRRLAERKRRSGSAEELVNTSINTTNLNNSTTINLSNNLSESNEKLINAELMSNTENTTSTTAAVAAVAAAHQLLREQQQTTSILLDSSKNLSIASVNMPPVQSSSINIVNQQNNGNSSIIIQSNVQPISLIPSIMNVRPSTDNIVVTNHNVTQQIVAAAAAAQFNTTSPQQNLEHIAKTIVSHQQHQLEQMAQTLQQQTTNNQKLEPMDHEPSVLSTTTNNISLEQQQQNVSQTLINQVAQSLANQQHQQQQFDQAVQSFAAQQNQQNLSIGGNGHNAQSCITSTTAICPTFCTDQQVTSSHNQLNNNTIISQTDANIAAAAVAVAQQHQPISNILNTNSASQQNQQQHQVEHANLAAVVQQHQIMQQQVAVQQLQQFQNQQMIAQQQQAAAVQQQIHQQQIAAVVAAASCMQSSSSSVISNSDIAAAAAAAVAATQPQPIINNSTQQNSSTLPNNQSFVLDSAVAVANILPSQTIVPSASSTLSATVQPTSTHQSQTQQTQTTILPQLMDMPNAAAAVASILPPQAIVPSVSSTLSVTAQTTSSQQLQTQPTQTSILPQLMELPSAAAVVAAAAVSQPSISQDMVTVPKEVLIKLVEHKIESDQQQQQSEAKPTKCQCHCNCGRYPTDMLIVDKVMTDLLENSSKQCSIETRRNSSFQSTPPAPDQLMSNNNLTNTSSNLNLLPLNQSVFYSGQISKQQTTSNLDANNSAMETTSEVEINADYCKLALCDEESLKELVRANGIWNSEPGETQYGVTESGLRRLIKTINSIATFRLLDRNDQTLLLKHGCESYFILRGITSFNENKIQILLQNGVSENTIGFYKDFPIKWRKNETVVLLLGMILLFNPEIPDLNSRLTVTIESLKYQSILKRVLYALCGNDIQMAAQTFNTLLSKLEHLQAVATLCALENVEPIVRQIFEPISMNVTKSGSIIGIGVPSNNLIIDNCIS